MIKMAGSGTKNKCKVFLLSGFLGSGKTTLLQNLLETVPDGERAAVLMNEFGKAGVDGDVVRKKGLEIIEISRGFDLLRLCQRRLSQSTLHHIQRL